MRKGEGMATHHNAYTRANECMTIKGGLQKNDNYVIKENSSNCCDLKKLLILIFFMIQ